MGLVDRQGRRRSTPAGRRSSPSGRSCSRRASRSPSGSPSASIPPCAPRASTRSNRCATSSAVPARFLLLRSGSEGEDGPTPAHDHVPSVSALVLAVAFGAFGCASAAKLPVSAGTGPKPSLPPPDTSLIPLINVVTAKGWPPAGKPVAAEGTAVAAFARGLDHPALALRAPERRRAGGGDERAPDGPRTPRASRAGSSSGIQKKAGGAVPSANRITLLRDADGDGVAETADRVPVRTQLALRHGARRGDAVRGEHRRRGARFPTPPARPGSRPPARRSSTCPPVRSTITGPRASSPPPTGPSCTWASAPTATWPSGAWPTRRAARRSGRWIVATGGAPRLRLRAAQPGRAGLGARAPGAVDGRERARRARQRSRPRLHDVGARRRLLRVAVQLLRPARGRAREAAAARPRGHGARAGLRAGPAHRLARAGYYGGHDRAARAVRRRHVRGTARLVESQAAQRLQGHLRALSRRRPRRRARSTS